MAKQDDSIKQQGDVTAQKIDEQVEATNDKESVSSENEKITELERKVKEFEDKWKRAVADYQNQEKWVRDQRGEWIKSANKDLILRILPILDTLLLAQQHSPVPSGTGHSKDQTLTISINQFQDILKSEGIIRIDTKGKDFDPYLMEAITAEAGEENKVVRELRSGYMLYDKVLRPAQVTVGKAENESHKL